MHNLAVEAEVRDEFKYHFPWFFSQTTKQGNQIFPQKKRGKPNFSAKNNSKTPNYNKKLMNFYTKVRNFLSTIYKN